MARAAAELDIPGGDGAATSGASRITQDVEAEAAQVLGEPSTLGDTNDWTNLNTFSSNGGKLLFYHGVSAHWFSSLDTVQVGKDQAPASVIATGNAFPGRSRPLCPHPQHTQYKGSGNAEDAASFECR